MRKKDKLYTANRWNTPAFMPKGNLFEEGGSTETEPVRGNTGGFFSKDNVGKMVGALGPAAGTIGNTLISNGYSSKAGAGISSVGSAVGGAISLVNPLVGGIVSAGSGLVGGLVNAAFGTKKNKKNIAAIEDNTSSLRDTGNLLSSASDNNTLLASVGSMGGSMGFKTTDLVKGGWFSKGKARRQGQRYLDKENKALQSQAQGLVLGANNADTSQDSDVKSGFIMAYGGPLDYLMDSSSMGAVEYGFMSDYLTSKKKQADAKRSSTSSYPTLFSEGGGIEIRHPGRLTKLKERTGKTEAELWKEGDKDVRSMITFARNARKWKKALGGSLDRDNVFCKGGTLFALGGDFQTNGADFYTGLSHINAGKSHEENPNDGVQVGVDSQGNPNLVEEGETIFNDYVYSNRIQMDDAAKEVFHISKKRDYTYAEYSKKLEKEAAERPNDPISQAALKVQMADLADAQEAQKARMEAERARAAFEALSPEEQTAVMQQVAMQEQQAMQEQAMQEQTMAQQQMPAEQPVEAQVTPEELAQQQMLEQQQAQTANVTAEGGNLFPDGGTINPYAYSSDWTGFNYYDPEKRQYDEGYLKFANNINQDWLDRIMSGQYGSMNRYLARNKGVSITPAQASRLATDGMYSDMHKAMASAYEDYLKGVNPVTGEVAAVASTPAPATPTVMVEQKPNAVPADAVQKAAEEVENGEKGGNDTTIEPVLRNEKLRYAGLFGPAVGLGLMAAGVGKPNYSGIDSALEIANEGASLADYKPIGNYIGYRPMDIWAEQNRLNANSRATDRAILNSSAPQGSRMAGLLANGYNDQIASGQLYRQALEYNDALRRQVAEFNRGTDQFNASAYNQTALTNAQIRNSNRQLRAEMAMNAALQKEAARSGWYNSLYGNIGGLFSGLSDLGRENAQHNMIARMAADGLYGTMTDRTNVGKGYVRSSKNNSKSNKRRNR